MPYPLPCVIFAGGKSSRMGRDKALLPFGGCDTLAEYQYRRLLPLFSSVYLSAKSDKFPFDAPLLPDEPALGFYAPTAGLLSALKKLESDIFVLSVDTPFVDETSIAGMVAAWRESPEAAAVIARSPCGRHPMCGIYTKKMLPALEAAVSGRNHRLGALLESAGTLYVDFASDHLFYNLNTPREYENARRRASF